MPNAEEVRRHLSENDPAFPAVVPQGAVYAAGMSLREYIATHALAGLLASGDEVVYAVNQAVDAADRLMAKLEEGNDE